MGMCKIHNLPEAPYPAPGDDWNGGPEMICPMCLMARRIEGAVKPLRAALAASEAKRRELAELLREFLRQDDAHNAYGLAQLRRKVRVVLQDEEVQGG